MTMTKTWNVAVTLTEEDGRTRAEAHLHGPGTSQLGLGSAGTPGGELRAKGLARCHPNDADVPMIGDEVAVSRALSDLAHQLLDTAARTIESRTGERAYVLP